MSLTCRVFVLLAGFCHIACSSDDEFGCVNAGQCGDGGACEPNGYCSFPDPECPSGRKYGSQSAAGVAGQCVAAEGGSTSASTSANGGSDSTTSAAPEVFCAGFPSAEACSSAFLPDGTVCGWFEVHRFSFKEQACGPESVEGACLPRNNEGTYEGCMYEDGSPPWCQNTAYQLPTEGDEVAVYYACGQKFALGSERCVYDENTGLVTPPGCECLCVSGYDSTGSDGSTGATGSVGGTTAG